MRAFGGPSANTFFWGGLQHNARAAAEHDDPNAVMYKIIVWGTLIVYAAILPERDLSYTQRATYLSFEKGVSTIQIMLFAIRQSPLGRLHITAV